MKNSEINIRDPFVLAENGRYYLFGTRGPTCWGAADGFDVYVGDDLENWSGPHACFQNDGSFWATHNYWAPEVHRWRGAYYMFASFKREGVCRGTAILRAESPMGPYQPWSDGPVTPAGWECLDGTFHVDRNGRPHIVFCHEWVQVGDGEMCSMPLADDLRTSIGAPRLLFHASDAPWSRPIGFQGDPARGFVTDGPFLWRTADGTLLLLWASMADGGAYAQGIAVSSTDDIDGSFRQLPPLFTQDGGHGMVFRTFDQRLLLTLHSPNSPLQERPRFFPVKEEVGTLVRI
jgi:arabinan endo-1,5-alpha-L-arabinosidase